MAHTHTHGSSCAHAHVPAPRSTVAEQHRAFAIGIALNMLFVVIEMYFGWRAHSLSLWADAVHNLGDVLALAVAWLGYYLAFRPATTRYTFGWGRASIYAALFNGFTLIVSSGWIIYESLVRLQHPVAPDGTLVAIVAAVGIAINLATALFLMRGQDDVNVKGAMVHMFGDAAVSAGVVITAFAIAFTGWLWLDPAVSIAIAVLVAWSAKPILRDATRLAMDAVPAMVDVDAVRDFFVQHPDVQNVFDLHVWGLSTAKNAMSAHVTIQPDKQHDVVLRRLHEELKEKFNLTHVTLQLEKDHTHCADMHD